MLFQLQSSAPSTALPTQNLEVNTATSVRNAVTRTQHQVESGQSNYVCATKIFCLLPRSATDTVPSCPIAATTTARRMIIFRYDESTFTFSHQGAPCRQRGSQQAARALWSHLNGSPRARQRPSPNNKTQSVPTTTGPETLCP